MNSSALFTSLLKELKRKDTKFFWPDTTICRRGILHIASIGLKQAGANIT
jgi:hypothetical protein